MLKTHYIFFTFVRYIPNIVSKDIFISECINGYYGNDCINQCSVNCDVTSRCEKSTGQCDEGCIPGLRGIMCNQSKCFTSYLMVCTIYFFLAYFIKRFLILLDNYFDKILINLFESILKTFHLKFKSIINESFLEIVLSDWCPLHLSMKKKSPFTSSDVVALRYAVGYFRVENS